MDGVMRACSQRAGQEALCELADRVAALWRDACAEREASRSSLAAGSSSKSSSQSPSQTPSRSSLAAGSSSKPPSKEREEERRGELRRLRGLLTRSSVEVRCVTLFPHLAAAPLLAALVAAGVARGLLRALRMALR